METYIHVWIYLAQLFLEWEMFQTKVGKKIKTHILCSKNSSENCALCEIRLENIVQPDRPQITIWRMCTARWEVRLQTHTQIM